MLFKESEKAGHKAYFRFIIEDWEKKRRAVFLIFQIEIRKNFPRKK